MYRLIVCFLLHLLLAPLFSQELIEDNTFNTEVADSILVQEKPLKAVREFKEALKELPNNQSVKYYIAKAYVLIPDHEKALYWLNHIVKDDANIDNEILELYIDELNAVGRFEIARFWLEKTKLNLDEYNYNSSVDNSKLLLKDTSFIKITRLDLNSEQSDFCPVFYKNGIIYYSNREKSSKANVDFINNAEADILFVDASNEDYSNPVDYNFLIGYGYYEGAFTFYNDYKKMYVSKYLTSQNSNIKEQDKLMGLRLFESDIDVASNKLYTLDPLPFNIHGFSFAHPTTSADGNVLVFASNIPGSKGGSDLYVVRKENDAWLPPENLGDKINSPYDEYFPYLFQDSILFYTSNKPGGYGNFDIYKTNLNGKVGSENMGAPVNSESDDFSFIVSENGLDGYFTSNRDKNSKEDIYKFQIVTVSIQDLVDELLGENAIDNVDVVYTEGARISHRSINQKSDDTSSNSTTYKTTNEVTTESTQLSGDQTGIQLNFRANGSHGAENIENENIDNVKGQIVIKQGETILEVIDIPDRVNISNFFSLREEINEKIGNLPKQGIVESAGTIEKEQTSNLVFRVQIAASKKELSEKELAKKYRGERPILMFEEEGWKKYYIGEFHNYFVAEKIKKEAGVKDAFIAAYEQDHKLVLMEALRSQYQQEKEEYKILKEEVPDNWEIIKKQEIYFDFNSFDESQVNNKSLDDIVQLMNQEKILQLAIFAYADFWGSADYNLALSAERGKTVRNSLVNKGISEQRITVKSVGEKFTNGNNNSYQLYNKQENKLNRKVEFIIYKIK